MKTLLIINPGSRSGKGRKLWSFWESELKAKGAEFDSVTTANAGHAIELAKAAHNYDAVIAVGGDGTINEVLDGIMQSERSDIKMGILYSGTSPDFCKFHGIPVTPQDALDVLCKGESNRIDVAEITYTKKDDSKTLSHFGCGSNVGLGASVARKSNSTRRFTGDSIGTCIALVRSITTMQPMDLDLEIDGVSLHLSKVNNLSILKNPYIASGLKLNLDLSATDNQLALFAVHGKTRLSILNILPEFYSGKAVERDDVFCRTCSRVRISCSSKREIEFDGDPRGFLPAEIKVIPKALNLIGARE